ncbi:unnamed protein product [Leptosia nina]|uniref:Uncharacterized protein n=1 Tax=Leptosia nina TaxID=320188 RepID=A0AAV1JBP4_9NEOP
MTNIIKQNRIVHNVKLKQENIELRSNIELHILELDNMRLAYDTETQELHKEIDRLENLVGSLISKFQESQEMVEKYSSTMDDLIKLSTYTAEYYESQNISSCDPVGFLSHKSNPSPLVPKTLVKEA